MAVKKLEDYEINGNVVRKPLRKTTEQEREKYKQLQRSKKNRQRRLKEERKRNRRAIMQITILIFFMGVLTIFRDSKVFAMQNDLANVNSDIKEEQLENEALKIDLLKGSSLDNIKTTAEKDLGMTIASKDNMVEIDLSENYFQKLDDRDKKAKEKKEKGFFSKILNALS